MNLDADLEICSDHFIAERSVHLREPTHHRFLFISDSTPFKNNLSVRIGALAYEEPADDCPPVTACRRIVWVTPLTTDCFRGSHTSRVQHGGVRPLKHLPVARARG
jgi:hypothetical protein